MTFEISCGSRGCREMIAITGKMIIKEDAGAASVATKTYSRSASFSVKKILTLFGNSTA